MNQIIHLSWILYIWKSLKLKLMTQNQTGLLNNLLEMMFPFGHSVLELKFTLLIHTGKQCLLINVLKFMPNNNHFIEWEVEMRPWCLEQERADLQSTIRASYPICFS